MKESLIEGMLEKAKQHTTERRKKFATTHRSPVSAVRLHYALAGAFAERKVSDKETVIDDMSWSQRRAIAHGIAIAILWMKGDKRFDELYDADDHMARLERIGEGILIQDDEAEVTDQSTKD